MLNSIVIYNEIDFVIRYALPFFFRDLLEEGTTGSIKQSVEPSNLLSLFFFLINMNVWIGLIYACLD